MSKKRPHISQPLNFRHEGHIGREAPQQNSQVSHGHVYTEQNLRPELALPQPCPGPSIVQNIGSQTLDKSTIEQITSEIKDAVKQEFMALIETLEETISNTTARIKDNPYSNIARSPLNQYTSSTDRSANDLTNQGVKTVELDGGIRMANPLYDIKNDNKALHTSFKKRPIPTPRQSPGMYRTLPGRIRSKTHANQRDCFAMALKVHIENIVENCIFDISDLPDVLISEECLTEDESRTIRERVDRKDQVRILVSVMRTRDLVIIEKFVAFLGQHNSTLKQKIVETALKHKEEGFRERKCLICKVKSHVSVKYVGDRLWAEGLIQDDVYNQIIYSEKPAGAQNKLWELVLDNLARDDYSRRAFWVLENILRRKGHYEYLADGIKTILEQQGKERLECECKLHVRFSKILSSASGTSNAPSSSDSSVAASSLEILSDEISRKSTDLHDGSVKKKTGLSLTHGSKLIEEEKEALSDVMNEAKPDVMDTTEQPPPLPKKKSTMITEDAVELSTEDASYV